MAGTLLKPSIKPNNLNKCQTATLNQTAVYCLTFIPLLLQKSHPTGHHSAPNPCMSHGDVSLCKFTRNNTVLLITTMSGKKDQLSIKYHTERWTEVRPHLCMIPGYRQGGCLPLGEWVCWHVTRANTDRDTSIVALRNWLPLLDRSTQSNEA